jgi:hypothetical protein
MRPPRLGFPRRSRGTCAGESAAELHNTACDTTHTHGDTKIIRTSGLRVRGQRCRGDGWAGGASSGRRRRRRELGGPYKVICGSASRRASCTTDESPLPSSCGVPAMSCGVLSTMQHPWSCSACAQFNNAVGLGLAPPAPGGPGRNRSGNDTVGRCAVLTLPLALGAAGSGTVRRARRRDACKFSSHTQL